MKVCIISMKFSPAFVSHIRGYSKIFQEIGGEVFFLLDKKYNDFQDIRELPNVFFEIESLPKCDVAIFMNVGLNHHRIAKEIKKIGTKVLYLYHEPRDQIKNYLKEGTKQTLKALIAHYLSTLTLKNTDVVIVPSDYALKLYNSLDIKYCPNVLSVPLIYDDELNGSITVDKKMYFSYIGHAVKGHAFENFLQFVEYAYKQETGIRFQIATRTDISHYFEKYKFLREMIKSGNLKANSGRVLTNEEINKAYESSFCVWNIYNRSTQSGVLPKAFMFGTPVIANNIGSFPEFVKDGYNGFLVNSYDGSSSFGLIVEKAFQILSNLQEMSNNARNTFLEKFYYKNYVRTFVEIFKLV